MSNWTHVAAVVRIDSLGYEPATGLKPEAIFGKSVIWKHDHFREFCEEMKYAQEDTMVDSICD